MTRATLLKTMAVPEFVDWLAYYRIEDREQREAQERQQQQPQVRAPRAR